MADDTSSNTLVLAAEIVAAYLGANGHVKAEELPAIIKSVREALAETAAPPAEAAGPSMKVERRAITKSVTPDALISFIDNKPYKTLKRHLARHGHDMASYRETYGLPVDYPSVAPSYSAARSAMAKSLGLGARLRNAAATPAAASPAKSARGGRKSKAQPTEG